MNKNIKAKRPLEFLKLVIKFSVVFGLFRVLSFEALQVIQQMARACLWLNNFDNQSTQSIICSSPTTQTVKKINTSVDSLPRIKTKTIVIDKQRLDSHSKCGPYTIQLCRLFLKFL